MEDNRQNQHNACGFTAERWAFRNIFLGSIRLVVEFHSLNFLIETLARRPHFSG